MRRALLFANLGRLRHRNPDDQDLQGECLTPLTNAIVCQNTVYTQAAIHQIEEASPVDDSIVARLSPNSHEHINLYLDKSQLLRRSVDVVVDSYVLRHRRLRRVVRSRPQRLVGRRDARSCRCRCVSSRPRRLISRGMTPDSLRHVSPMRLRRWR